MNVQTFFDQLVAFARGLTTEAKFAVAKNPTEDNPRFSTSSPALTNADTRQVKQTARNLLATLNAERLVLKWRKRQQARRAVRVCIVDIDDRELPQRYDRPFFGTKVKATFRHIYETYYRDGAASPLMLLKPPILSRATPAHAQLRRED